MEFVVQNFSLIMFYLLAAMAVAGAVGVIALRNPVHAAISLLWTFLIVAALFVLRHAEFLAAVQVMVYAGGIMVLFLFVIMMVNVKRLQPEQVFLSRLAPAMIAAGVLLGALIASGVLLGTIASSSDDKVETRLEKLQTAVVEQKIKRDDGTTEVIREDVKGNTEAVGWTLYRTYLVPFEVVSVLLLVAMVAAIVFGRRDAAMEGRMEQ